MKLFNKDHLIFLRLVIALVDPEFFIRFYY